MLVPNNPDIDVARLLEVVRQELVHSRQSTAMHPSAPTPLNTKAVFDREKMATLSSLIDTIQQRSAPRGEIPERLRQRFPFFRLGFIQRIITRVHRIMLYDQHHANQATTDALRLLANEVANLYATQEANTNSMRSEMLIAMDAKIEKMARQLEELRSQRTQMQGGRYAELTPPHHREASIE